jgi:hypothetical protein
MTTLVSCYYKLGKSKHTHEEYDTWIRNLLVNINTNIVIFTSQTEKSYLETILERNKNIQYTIIVKELSDLEINKLYPYIWEDQEMMDPNKRCGRARGCYQLWNSKFHFLKEVIEKNPYNSEYFVWNDIGNIRDKNIIPFLKSYPNKEKISKDKLDIILLNGFTKVQDFFCDEVHFSGSMFGGHKNTVLMICDLYYKFVQYYIVNNRFIGCDQQIISSIFVKHMNLFNPIIPTEYKVDPWFYLYEYYSHNVSVGFYFNCYKNKFATENILLALRKHYPTEKVFLMCDNGDDFTEIANKYNCKYYYSDVNILGGRIINNKKCHCFSDINCARHYLNVIQMAMDYCNSDYLILMEDDVLIMDKIQKYPLHSGGDKNSNNFDVLFKDKSNILNVKYPDRKFSHWNLAGGSIVHINTLKECIQNTNIDDLLELDNYCKPNLEVWHTNDVLLSFILMINGKTNELWTNTNKSNIIHPYKGFYNKSLSINEGVYRN